MENRDKQERNQEFRLRDAKGDVAFHVVYSKRHYLKSLVKAVVTGLFLIGLAGTDYYFYITEKGELPGLCLAGAILVAFFGFFWTTSVWKKFLRYDAEVSFFKMWQKEVGVCDIGQKDGNVYVVFDLLKYGKLNKKSREFLDTYKIVEPIIYMKTGCTDHTVEEINGVTIYDECGLECMMVRYLVEKTDETAEVDKA